MSAELNSVPPELLTLENYIYSTVYILHLEVDWALSKLYIKANWAFWLTSLN
jgi:hypothetical protein